MNVVITGTSSGLGLTLAQLFKATGHRVFGSAQFATGNPTDLGSKHADGVLDTEDPARSLEQQVDIFADHVLQQFDGRVDVLVNNAGTNAIRPFEVLSQEFIEGIMRANFLLAVLLTQRLLPGLSKAQGTVVNVISDAAWRPMRHSLAYNCSKAALDMATKQMARELTKPCGVTVFGVRPGKMAGTEMSRYIDEAVCATRGWTPEEARAYFAANTVSGLESSPEHVAKIIFDLVQSPARRTLSGACMDLVG